MNSTTSSSNSLANGLSAPISRRRLGALGLGAMAAALGGGVLTSSPAVAGVIQPSAWSHLGGLNALGQAIWNAVLRAQAGDNREGAVQNLLNGSWYESGQGKNVLVIKDDHPYSISGIEGLDLEATYSYDGMPTFRVFVMDTAVVTNNGDGGLINWAYQGWFERTDMTVNFLRH